MPRIELCAYDFLNMNAPTLLLKRATKPVSQHLAVPLYIYGVGVNDYWQNKTFSQSLKTASISNSAKKFNLINEEKKNSQRYMALVTYLYMNFTEKRST